MTLVLAPTSLCYVEGRVGSTKSCSPVVSRLNWLFVSFFLAQAFTPGFPFAIANKPPLGGLSLALIIEHLHRVEDFLFQYGAETARGDHINRGVQNFLEVVFDFDYIE